MLESKEFHIPSSQKATLLSLVNQKLEGHSTEDETNASLDELVELLRTLNIPVFERFFQRKKDIDPTYFLGKGKVEEIALKAKENGSELLVFDTELTASQVRNIHKLTGLNVVDRCNVILEIFAQHARTKEAQTQIEISRLQYLLPRLTNFWSHLGRQKGGIGVRGGEGEQQLELDRRIIRSRIEFLKKQLVGLERSRKEQGKKRQKQAIIAALVGYTNAGKSSLMNRLCRVNVKEENKLFATLDATYRMLSPDTKPPMLLIDSVGFISNLPNTLVEGFKTTLESAIEADLLIIVCDISDPHYKKHLKVTFDVLEELGMSEKEYMIVFNKKDKLTIPFQAKIITRQYKNSFLVSSYDESDIDHLRDTIIEFFLEKQQELEVFVPYDDGRIHSTIACKTNIIKTNHLEEGIFYRIRVPRFILGHLGLGDYIMDPEHEFSKNSRSEK